MRKQFCLLAIFLVTFLSGKTQNVAINDDGSLPNISAMLDVKSANKGLLIPRVALTATDMASPITSPATSLLVYNTATAGSGITAVIPGFYHWDGAAWVRISSSANISSSAWTLGGNAGTNSATNFIGTTDNQALVFKVNNQFAGKLSVSDNNTSWGYQALLNNTGGFENTANGTGALYSNTTGAWNTANGFQALYSNTTGTQNTGNGNNALYSNTTGSANTASGNITLYSNTTGYTNTAVGQQALYYNTTGNSNSAIGAFSLLKNTTGSGNVAKRVYTLFENTTGSNNTANGGWALESNTTGNNNSATGISALYSNTTGGFNTANGYQALFTNTGNYNTANGAQSLYSNTTGSQNTANGYQALNSNITGNQNTANGRAALFSNTTGSFNTAIGDGSDVSTGALTNATAIGANAIVDASNKVRIGNSSVTVIEGQVAFTNPSDGRFKYNIKEDVGGLDFIMQLRPVTYNFDTQKQDDFINGKITGGQLNNYVRSTSYNGASFIRRTGFIAQEVEVAAKKTGYDFDGIRIPQTEKQYYSLSYASFVVPLVKAMQEQQQQIKEQQMQIDKLSKENEELKSLKEKIEALEKAIKNLSSTK